MLMMQYAHRLPADYDMSRIEERAATRGTLWNETSGLGFKAFAAQRRENGAADNVYTSIYLWREPAAALTFLTDDRFGAVLSGFGRPTIETWLPIDVAVDAQHQAAPETIVRHEADIDRSANIADVCAQERSDNALLGEHGAVAVASGFNLERWRLVRFSLWPHAARMQPGDIAYEILHLARSGWTALATPPAAREAA